MSDASNPAQSESHTWSEGAREMAGDVRHSAASAASECATHYVREPARDVVGLMRDYSREKPDVAALWCFAIGVLVGWKLKP